MGIMTGQTLTFCGGEVDAPRRGRFYDLPVAGHAKAARRVLQQVGFRGDMRLMAGETFAANDDVVGMERRHAEPHVHVARKAKVPRLGDEERGVGRTVRIVAGRALLFQERGVVGRVRLPGR
jgi:hypothetical protein